MFKIIADQQRNHRINARILQIELTLKEIEVLQIVHTRVRRLRVQKLESAPIPRTTFKNTRNTIDLLTNNRDPIEFISNLLKDLTPEILNLAKSSIEDYIINNDLLQHSVRDSLISYEEEVSIFTKNFVLSINEQSNLREEA